MLEEQVQLYMGTAEMNSLMGLTYPS